MVQARIVAKALADKFPGLEVQHVTRQSLGDRDSTALLTEGLEKGLFTADLSDALVAGEADLVVHSWKDLPIEARPDTVMAGTLKRADVRDVLLVQREAVVARPPRLVVLTSSPRRAWQLSQSIAPLLPWRIQDVEPVAVRGNVPTRLEKLSTGEAHALVVAKAALDRLLSDHTQASVRDRVRTLVGLCQWMVLPVREFPSAPAQGALAIEVARRRSDILAMVASVTDRETQRACELERDALRAHGGGCHEAIGVTVLTRDYGTITSARGRSRDGDEIAVWRLDRRGPTPARVTLAHVYPRPDERGKAERRSLPVTLPADVDALWVARAEAWPDTAPDVATRVVWAAGTRTWKKLAARSVWVNGCAEGLGDGEDPNVDLLAGRPVPWHRLTHTGSNTPHASALYEVSQPLPADLASRTHFYWTSGSHFERALATFPAIREGWHASGPGRTAATIARAINSTDRASVWLDYDEWLEAVST